MRAKLTRKLLIAFGITLLLTTAGTLSYYSGRSRLARAYLDKNKERSVRDDKSVAKVVTYSDNLADFRIQYWGRFSGYPFEMSWADGDKLWTEIQKGLEKKEGLDALQAGLFDYVDLAMPLDMAKEYAVATKIVRWASYCLAAEAASILCFILPIIRFTKSWFKSRWMEIAGAPQDRSLFRMECHRITADNNDYFSVCVTAISD